MVKELTNNKFYYAVMQQEDPNGPFDTTHEALDHCYKQNELRCCWVGVYKQKSNQIENITMFDRGKKQHYDLSKKGSRVFSTRKG